jgi:hypothetical protein
MPVNISLTSFGVVSDAFLAGAPRIASGLINAKVQEVEFKYRIGWSIPV